MPSQRHVSLKHQFEFTPFPGQILMSRVSPEKNQPKMDYYLKQFRVFIEALNRYKILFAIELVLSLLIGITLVFPVLAVILGLSELGRLFIKISLWLVYGDKYELSSDAVGNNYTTVMPKIDRHTVLYVGELDGPLDLQQIRENFQKHVIDNKVYSNLLTRIYEEKWFYMCLKKVSFDIANHVKFYPGTENRTVSEEELLKEILPALGKDMTCRDRPQWELLVIPSYQPASNKAEEDTQFSTTKAIKIIRIHHGYMDGGSTLLMIANTFTDEGKSFPYVIDPCKPLKISMLSKILYKLTSLALFSSSALSSIFHPPFSKYSRFTPNDSENAADVLYSWTNKISIQKFQKIKEKSGVSMPAIVTTVISGAIRNLELMYPDKRNGMKIPKEQPLWLAVGMFPYSGRKPCNNHLAMESTMNTSDISAIERLTLMADLLGRLAKNPKVMIFWWQNNMIGRAPAMVTRLFLKLASCPTILSNIPLSTRNIKMWGNECHGIAGWAPLLCKSGLGIVTVRYADHFRYCVQVDSSVVNQEELDYFVTQLEQQVELLCWETTKLKRRISTDVSLHVREKEFLKSDLLSPTSVIKEDEMTRQSNNNIINNRNNFESDVSLVNTEISSKSVGEDAEISSQSDFSSEFVLKLKDNIQQIKHGIQKIKEQ